MSVTETVDVRCCADVDVTSADNCDAAQNLLHPSHLGARAAVCEYTSNDPSPTSADGSGISTDSAALKSTATPPFNVATSVLVAAFVAFAQHYVI